MQKHILISLYFLIFQLIVSDGFTVSHTKSKALSAFQAIKKPFYRIIEIQTLGGDLSSAYGINEHSQITGVARNEGGELRAFIWDNGDIKMLPMLPEFWHTYGYSINDHAEVVGHAQIINSFFVHAFFFSGDSIIDLGTLDGNSSTAFSLNNKSQIVGQTDMYLEGSPPESDIVGRAFLFKDEQMNDAGTLGGWASQARSINEQASIVGGAEVAIEVDKEIRFEWHAFYRSHDRDENIDIGTITGPYSEAYAINNNDIVVGDSNIVLAGNENNNTYNIHAFLWEKGRIRDLSSLEACLNSYARAINDYKQIVGFACNNEKQKAVLWHQNKIYDLNRLIVQNHDWILSEAQDINNKGEIIGTGMYQGKQRGFLLKPISR